MSAAASERTSYAKPIRSSLSSVRPVAERGAAASARSLSFGYDRPRIRSARHSRAQCWASPGVSGPADGTVVNEQPGGRSTRCTSRSVAGSGTGCRAIERTTASTASSGTGRAVEEARATGTPRAWARRSSLGETSSPAYDDARSSPAVGALPHARSSTREPGGGGACEPRVGRAALGVARLREQVLGDARAVVVERREVAVPGAAGRRHGESGSEGTRPGAGVITLNGC